MVVSALFEENNAGIEGELTLESSVAHSAERQAGRQGSVRREEKWVVLDQIGCTKPPVSRQQRQGGQPFTKRRDGGKAVLD